MKHKRLVHSHIEVMKRYDSEKKQIEKDLEYHLTNWKETGDPYFREQFFHQLNQIQAKDYQILREKHDEKGRQTKIYERTLDPNKECEIQREYFYNILKKFSLDEIKIMSILQPV
jgi:hypothetical protein